MKKILDSIRKWFTFARIKTAIAILVLAVAVVVVIKFVFRRKMPEYFNLDRAEDEKKTIEEKMVKKIMELEEEREKLLKANPFR